MSGSVKALEPAFQGAGQRAGIEIWRIENFQPVPLPKSDYGKFYSGDSYIVLQTTSGKGGAYLFDIHFWLGKDTSQDEAGTAAIKTVELDTILGGRAVQHREIQGHESDKFLSYFKPCIMPLEGGVASGFKTPEEEEFETRLYVCKGKRVVRMKQVPFTRSSLNHDDVFILDTKDKIYQFNGANSNIQERAKALEIVQFLKDTYHNGVSHVGIVDDGNLQAEADSGEFWELFGGFAPISRKVASDDDIIPERTPAKLFCIANGELNPVDGELSKSMLESANCYLLDCGAEVYVWVGRVTQLDERKAATQAAEEFLSKQNRPKSTQITRLIQGHETNSFKLEFDSWPSGSTSAPEEGRGKVAALLKQQGGGIKSASKSTPAKEEVVPPLLEGGGKIEVWCINDDAKTPVPKEDFGKFYSGDCYIVSYSYHSHDKKEDHYICWWIGNESVEEDQKMAAELAIKMFNSLKGRPVLGRVFQGKEPPQFIAIFQPMVILKGGLSSGYKNHIAEKGLDDETYTADSIALIRISGTSAHNNKTIQVDEAATSLNSNECFLLQSASMFIWHGIHSTYEQQQLASKIAEFLKPGAHVKHTKEGAEISAFWSTLGGKENYTSKQAPLKVSVRDPHLFTYCFNRGKFEVKEVYNFCQDDLLTEDVLILDTYAEVFVWIGQLTDSNEKQTAFEIGQKYIEMAASLDGLSPNVPLYKVTEGNEPCFFTVFFSWDSAKATAFGNSFQKKAMLLHGAGHDAGRADGTNHDGPTQRASALAALNTAFSSSSSSSSKPSSPRHGGTTQGSQRAAAMAALSSVLTAEKKEGDDSEVAAEDKEPQADESVAETNEEEAEAEHEEENDDNGNGHETDLPVFSYEQLKAKSEDPVSGIDFKKREAYLSDEEFETVLEMTKKAFYKLPKWKQDQIKKKVDLF